MRYAGRLPLFWKLLLPFLLLLGAVGSAGTFLLVRNQASRAQQVVDQRLAQRSLDVRSYLHDRETYVQESSYLAANLRGMAEAVQGHRSREAAVLLQSVLALKSDITVVAVTDLSGRTLAAFSRTGAGERPSLDPSMKWSVRTSGLVVSGGRRQLVLETPICAGATGCRSVGYAVAGLAADQLLGDAQSRDGGVALYDSAGALVAERGLVPHLGASPPGAFVRQNTTVGKKAVATLFAPLTIQGRQNGTLAVTVPTARTYAGVNATAHRLGLILLAAMLGIVLIGSLLARYLLAQVRALLVTNRALTAGDLSARVEVRGRDELSELAVGVNTMAQALQLSYENLESRVAERTDEVQRLLTERTAFFTAVSHEFRTPLAVILGQARMLADPSFQQRTAWHDRSAKVLTEAANQLLGFVNDIVDIAKVDSGNLDVELVEIDLGALVRDLAPTIETIASQSGLEFVMRVPRRVPKVSGDQTLLREALLNLVDNASKYTPAGGRITIVVDIDDGRVRVSVTDTGIGIPSEARPRLFEPFYRVKGNETQAGQPSSGLGLALTRRLVEAQGGEIAYASNANKRGSTFVLRLPLLNPTSEVA